MRLTFRLVDLLWLTAYFAVAAWLASLSLWLLIPVWLCTVLGFEIGARSDFKLHLLTVTLCGTVSGLAFSLAIFGVTSIYQSHPTVGIDLISFASICLSSISGVTGLAIIYWLWMTATKSTKANQR